VRRSWRGIISGALALALLDALVQTTGAASRVSGWLSGTGKVVNDFLSPTVPTFAASTTSATAETQALTTVPATTVTPTPTTPATVPPNTPVPPGETIA
jgi:hypothetical protein